MTWSSMLKIVVAGLAGLSLASPIAQVNLRRGGKVTYHPNAERADAVKEAFQRGWDGYYKYAFPHDSLRPVTNGYEDDRYEATPRG